MPERRARNLIQSAAVSAFRIPTEQPEESDGTATWNSTTLVIVELHAGNTGGLGFTYSDVTAAHLAQELIRKEVLGKDPFAIPEIHSALDREVRNMGRPGLVSTAISAIDTCLWDLKARLLECSLLELLGQHRASIPAYGSGGFTSYSERQLIDQLTGWAAEGIRFVKMKIGRHPADDISRIRAVQKALNGKAQIFVDANGAYSRKQALHQAEQFAAMGVAWFEEPLNPDALDDFVTLRNASRVPIAGGECLTRRQSFQPWLEARAFDIVQPDVTKCGGLSEQRRIAWTAHQHGVRLIPHGWNTALGLASDLQLASAFADIDLVEYLTGSPFIDDLAAGGFRLDADGKLAIPCAPGLGVAVNLDALAEFSRSDVSDLRG